MNWRDQPLAVLDVETTGLRPGEDWTVEIAVVHVDGDSIGASRSWLVRPGAPIPPEASAIHGIDDALVADVPGLASVGPEVLSMLVGRVPVGYNAAAFDRPFLAADWLRADPYGAMPAQLHPRSRWMDVLIWIREKDRYVKGSGRHRLSVTCERWGVALPQAHRAEGDALACAALLLELARRGVIPSDLDEALGQQAALAAEQDRRHREWIASQPPKESP